MKKKIIFGFLMFVSTIVSAQNTYLTAGWASSRLEKSYLYTPNGVNLSIGKDFVLWNSGFKAMNHLDIAILFSDINSDSQMELGNILSLSPKIGYEFRLLDFLTIIPFAGPFGALDIGLRTENILFEGQSRSRFRYGVDFGFAADLHLTNRFTLRLIPLRVQYGNEYFRHGFMQLGFSL